MMDLSNKDFKTPIFKMLRELKEDVERFKKMMYKQNRNINSLSKFKLECYNFRMLNIIPLVDTKKIVQNIHKRKGERNLNISLQKNQLNTKEDSNAGSEKL